MQLPPPDGFFLDATIGWLMLENTQEARLEFEQIAPAYRQRPAVLDAEWRLLAAELRWEDSLRPAEAEVSLAPESPEGWIHRSFSLHELKRTAEAWEKLLPTAARFPREPTIPYNLACYACQLGELAQARTLLKVSVQIESAAAAKRHRLELAATDPDLQPLWEEIKKQLEQGRKDET